LTQGETARLFAAARDAKPLAAALVAIL